MRMDSSYSGLLLVLTALAAAESAPCPPLQSSTVTVECSLAGEPVDCRQQSAPGTRATFRCKPLHQFLYGYLPASGYESSCGEDGQWSVQPFRCVPVCGQPTGQPKAFVRNGEPVETAAHFPWHVVVYEAATRQQICGGSLITAKYFVSAAHCFFDNTVNKQMPPSKFEAALAKTWRSVERNETTAQFRKLAKIHLKDYGAKRLQYANDIALLELSEALEINAWTLPVCVDWGLELPHLKDGEEGVVVGFGNTVAAASEVLRFAKLPFVRSDVCRKEVADSLAIFSVQDDKYCVGFTNNVTVGPGDSGGGLTFPNENRVWFLRGVVSVGSILNTATYSFFTNVTAFVPWISGVIQQGELSGRRCGVDLAEASIVDGAVLDRSAFPWEMDVFFQSEPEGEFVRLWGAALVKPNLVITTFLGWLDSVGRIDLKLQPASRLRVAPRGSADKQHLQRLANVSEVVRLFTPGEARTRKHGPDFKIVLLELKQPLNLMPVCVDWTGSALLRKKDVGMTFVENPNHRRLWKRTQILGTNTCADKYYPFDRSLTYFICIVQEGGLLEGWSSTPMLYEEVDNVWFLRGVWFATITVNDTAIFFSDLSDSMALLQLTKTMDMLGKPYCGHADLCGPLAAGTGVVGPGHLPWSVVVVVEDAAQTTWGSGLLVLPNAILTDSALVVNTTGWNGKGEFPLVPLNRISIRRTGSDGRTEVSKVIRVAVHPSSRPVVDSRPRGDVALLELDPSTAVFEAPACLDLSGKVLQQFDTGYTGLVETWSARGSALNNSLVGTPYVAFRDCAEALTTTSYDMSSDQFCTNSANGSIGATVRGAAYLVWAGSRWFVQGLYTGVVDLPESKIMVATDFRDNNLRSWLRKQLDDIRTVYSVAPADVAQTKCETGLRPTSECGKLLTTDDIPWDVVVWQRQDDGGWFQRAGTVLNPYLVLTDAGGMFVKTVVNGSTTVRMIPAYRVIIKFNYPGIGMVGRIHLRWRRYRLGSKPSHDLALLELKAPLLYMPACLPAPVWGGTIQPPLGLGSSGMVKLKEDLRMYPLQFRSTDTCQSLAPLTDEALIAGNTFCAETTDKDQDITPGTAFLVPANGTWYLRGVHIANLTEEDERTGLHYFISLDDSKVLLWLVEHMRRTEPLDAVLPQLLTPRATKSKQAHQPSASNALTHVVPTAVLYHVLCASSLLRSTTELWLV